ncbi:MAG: hypothetical protein WBP79_07660, partial [Candidatus Acidiferrales bacterium]
MQRIIYLIWAAGTVQLLILAANFILPEKLRCRENLARMSPMLRDVFIVHWIYILMILGIFSAICIWFAPELAGASRLGHF